ncbi:uncharacterized protein LOC124276555 [Haliotis rubra]|uniref:uncharacterized protein LOC124276555 n=1 Tax=Haliotis rubra TaxID=36100 RepID=UPI001EE4EB4F|nr:uncharacterized protein LOC124276555 [Haliotis rubra]
MDVFNSMILRSVCLVVVLWSFGTSAQDTCHCLNPTQCANFREQGCSPCQSPWWGPYCQAQNIAYSQVTQQKSVYVEYDALGNIVSIGNSNLAVDGSKTTTDIRTCARTLRYTTGTYFTLRLPSSPRIAGIRVYFPIIGDSLEGLQILVDGDLCYESTTATLPVDIPCSTTLIGSNITLYLPRERYLSVCEIEVNVCGDGWYGAQCEKRCTCKETDPICNPINGACPSGCPDGYGDVDCKVCADGRYGTNCSAVCGNCLNGVICDKTTGVCPNGCTVGFFTSKCNTQCSDGRFGPQCASVCGSCQNKQPCDKQTGACPAGCAPGYSGIMCSTPCNAGTYGTSCQFACGRCRNGDVCDTVSGMCFKGCDAGWTGVTCNTECGLGTFGQDCVQTCGHCKVNTVCSTVNGFCPEGCSPGFAGAICQTECPSFTYGSSCSNRCGQCKDSTPCDKITGLCPGDCQPGYKRPYCRSACDDGTYGANCESSCGSCRNKAPCDKVTGSCPSGCDPGKTGNLCVEDCAEGTYGSGCSFNCGRCRPGVVCDRVDGSCPSGCQDGYNGTLCLQTCPRGTYGFSCFKRCGQCLDLESCDFATGVCPSTGCRPGWRGALCNEVCTDRTYGSNCNQQCGNCTDDDLCDKENGRCPNGCKPGYKWEQCQTKCDPGRYGQGCSFECGKCKDGAPCNHVDGSCPDGCVIGWTGVNCDKECPNGYYGDACVKSCGRCKDNVPCNKVTGLCSACAPGWITEYCNTNCPNGTFGAECNSPCGACKDAAYCQHVTGDCPDVCEPGWQGLNCLTECENGTYGERCQETCGQCKAGTTCNKVTGDCEGGCGPGFKGTQCRETCDAGTFGDACSLTCGHCDTASCKSVTGACPSCLAGWKGDTCTEECEDGKHGPNCANTCGTCQDGVPCNRTSGVCPTGCMPGFTGQDCTLRCPDGSYGDGCATECGRCQDSVACDYITGVCPEGCQPSWIGDKCDKECDIGYYGDDCNNTCGRCAGEGGCDKVSGACPFKCQKGFTGLLCVEPIDIKTQEGNMSMILAVVFTLVIALAVILCVVVVCCYRRRRERINRNSSDRILDPLDDGDPFSRAANGKVPIAFQNQIYNTAGRGSVLSVQSENTKHRSDLLSQLDPVPDTESSSLGFSTTSNTTGTSALTPSRVQAITTDEDGFDIESVNSEFNWPSEDNTSTAFSVYEINEHIELKMAAGGFENEFSLLPNGLRKSHAIGLLPENQSKNRYPRVLPYDDCRVVLSQSDGTDGSSYINASHIDGYTIMEEYIATQGPTAETVNDFWRMLWERNVCKVVMLGRTKENGKVKCQKYWPDIKDGKTYGNLSVTCIKMVSRAHYTVREFYVYDHQAAEKRVVTQFQFASWLADDFPSTPALVGFIKHVNKLASPTCPVVVHCSSGVGRTGTFIAINAMVEQARAEPEVDVFKFVCRMRLHRPEMVRTRVQYAGVHLALQEMLASKDTLLSSAELMEKYRTQSFRSLSASSRPRVEYQVLESMRPTLSEEDTQFARRQENVEKNRSMNILPGVLHRVLLKGTTRNPNPYINAVYLPSVLHRRGFIVTQQPLFHSVEQFWTLVQEQESVTIVSLTPPDLNPVDLKDYGEYMPLREGEALSVGKFDVLLKSTVNTREEIPEKTLILRTKGEDDFTPSRHVKVFSVPDWSANEDIPSNKLVLLLLLEMLVKRQKDAGLHPIIVHCLDGASRSGLFCAVSNIISRLKMDKEVDIFLIVRELQCIRPAIITSSSQYTFCFEVARNYLKNPEPLA